MQRPVTALLLLALLALSCAAEEKPPGPFRDPPRFTPTIKLVEDCLPSVVALRSFLPQKPGVFTVFSGSGSVIHEAGYILTNDHVVKHGMAGDASLPNLRPLPFRIVARFPHEDMALVKIDAPQPLKPLPLGRSNDLMLGEPALVIGNPGGVAHTISTGVISGLNRASATQDAFLPYLVQTSAATSGGSSGGPLINALGEQIGIITSKKEGAENINFAIVIDRIRDMFPRMLSVEQRCNFRLGMDVDMLGPAAKVTAVAEGSPAALSGVRVGDVVQRIDPLAVHHGVDFHIALLDRKPGQTLTLELKRGDEVVAAKPVLAPLLTPDPVADDGMVKGLRHAVYTGAWEKLPDFAALTPVETGKTDKVSLDVYKARPEDFALRFTGFIKIPAGGLYTLYTASDDGSQLAIRDQVVVDNDGLHANRESAGLIRLKPGLHPITVTFFQHLGDKTLSVSIEGPNLKKQEVPPDFFFIREDEKEPGK